MQRDYILRQIELLGAMLRRVFQLIAARETTLAASELAQVARQAGADLQLAKGLTGESLLALLSSGAEPDVTRCVLFAEILYVDGLRAEADGAAGEAHDSFAKALLLFEAAHAVTPVIATHEVAQTMTELRRRLGEKTS
jgi:hypothetical protein